MERGGLGAGRCADPQAKQRKETALARQVAGFRRPDDSAPAARRAGTTRHAGNAAKKKGPEIIRALVVVAVSNELLNQVADKQI